MVSSVITRTIGNTKTWDVPYKLRWCDLIYWGLFFFFTPNTFGYFYFCFSWEWILVWVIWSSTITKAIPESVRFGQYSAARRGSMITRQHIQRWQFVSLLSVTWLRSGVIAWITRPVLLTFTIYKRGTKLPRLYPSTPATLLTLSSPEKTYEGL